MDAMLSDHTMDDDEFFKELLSFLSSSKDPELMRIYALKFKEKGNSFYGQKDFVNAIIGYAKAFDVFSLVTPLEVKDETLFQDLAVQLNLSLAICSLKLHEYENAMNYCSWVLNVDSHNVKALYRRALAQVKLDRLIEAHSDLIMAQKFEPGNKEIKSELASIEKLLKFSQCGPKGLAGASPLDERRKSDSRSTMKILDDTSISTSKVSVEISSSPRTSIPIHNDEKMSFQEESSVLIPDTEDITSSSTSFNETDNTNLVEPMFQFGNRFRQGSSIHIPSSAYQRLANGEEIEFYNCGNASFMRIRIAKSIAKESSVSLKVGVENGILDCISSEESSGSVISEDGDLLTEKREEGSVICGTNKSSSPRSADMDSSSSISRLDESKAQNGPLQFVSK